MCRPLADLHGTTRRACPTNSGSAIAIAARVLRICDEHPDRVECRAFLPLTSLAQRSGPHALAPPAARGSASSPIRRKWKIADCGLSQEPQTNVCSTVAKKHEAGHEKRLYGTGNTSIGNEAARLFYCEDDISGWPGALHSKNGLFFRRATGRLNRLRAVLSRYGHRGAQVPLRKKHFAIARLAERTRRRV